MWFSVFLILLPLIASVVDGNKIKILEMLNKV